MTGTDLMLYSPVGEGGTLSGFDEQLLDMASKRMSGEQMYAELGEPPGMTPARCLQRAREIIKAQDWASVHDQKALLLRDFVKMRDLLWERISGTETKITKDGDVIDVDPGVGWYNALSRVLREWRTTIKEMQDDVEGSEAILRRAQAEVMISAISVMFERYNLKLDQAGVTLPDRNTLAEIFEEVMPLGFQVIESKVSR